jgi:predicted  nucleic acid-binding Zn-ribbon protein
VSKLRKFVVLLALAALALPVAACGDDDAVDQVDQARKDIRKQAKEIKGSIDDLSKQDLRNALNDAEDTAKNGSGDAKREARKLERKIQRELNQRD